MLIGITGYAQSGKDTVCDILRHHGVVTNRYAFADPLKEACNALFGWDERHSFGELKEVDVSINVNLINGNDFNLVCVKYGLDGFGLTPDDIHNELAKCLIHKLNLETGDLTVSPREVYQIFGTEVCRTNLHSNIWTMIAPIDDVAVPDVRFPNESTWARENNGVLIRVTNRNAKQIRKHESELYIDSIEVDIEIDNNGTLAQLESQVMEHFGISEDSSRLFPFTDGDFQYTESDVYVDRIKTVEGITDTHTQHGNWNYDEYMHGMANGLILCLAIMQGKDVVEFKDAPNEWLNQRQDSPVSGFDMQMIARDLALAGAGIGIDCHFGDGCPTEGCDCAS